jgi:hypothetical protein
VDQTEIQYQQCLDLLTPFFNGDRDKARSWMMLEIPGLGYLIPIRLIYQDRGQKVIDFIQTSLEENIL